MLLMLLLPSLEYFPLKYYAVTMGLELNKYQQRNIMQHVLFKLQTI